MFPKKIADLIRKDVNPLETGFHVFTAKESRHSYFYYVQASKKILLISKAYQQRKTADQALKRLYQKKPNLSYQSVSDKHKKQKHYLQLLDGNKKAMANSYAFSKLEDAKLAAKGFEASLQSITGKEAIPIRSPLQPPVRSRFRLDFYYDQREADLRGQIEYLLSREQKKFSGLDIGAIHEFISQQLAQDAPTKLVSKPKPVLQQKRRDIALHLQELGNTSSRSSFPVGTPIEVLLAVTTTHNDWSAATVYLKSLGSNHKMLLTEEKVSAARDGLKIPVYTQDLSPGFYQVIATLGAPRDTREATAAPYQTSSIVQLY
mgnify:CR=1 FL=1